MSDDAISYFNSCVRKSTWASQIPITLRINGVPDFGSEWYATMSRAGDNALQAWVRLKLPAIKAVVSSSDSTAAGQVKWIDNLGHALFDEVSMSVNDIVIQKFDNVFMDQYMEHFLDTSKYDAHSTMIGNTPALTTFAAVIDDAIINIPLPFSFFRDTGVSLPTAALPGNDIKINFRMKTYAPGSPNNMWVAAGGAGYALPGSTSSGTFVAGSTPYLKTVQVWTNYAVVTNEERVKMGQTPRDMLIEQTQKSYLPLGATVSVGSTINHDLRFSYAIKALYTNIRNMSTNAANQMSNYTTDNTYAAGFSPLDTLTLAYENTNRLDRMGSDFYMLVDPYYKQARVSKKTGYHSYSYAIRPASMQPTLSTNYSLINVVTHTYAFSPAAAASAAPYQALVWAINCSRQQVAAK